MTIIDKEFNDRLRVATEGLYIDRNNEVQIKRSHIDNQMTCKLADTLSRLLMHPNIRLTSKNPIMLKWVDG